MVTTCKCNRIVSPRASAVPPPSDPGKPLERRRSRAVTSVTINSDEMPSGQAIRRRTTIPACTRLPDMTAADLRPFSSWEATPDGAAMTDSGSDDVAVIVYREDDAWDVDLLPTALT